MAIDTVCSKMVASVKNGNIVKKVREKLEISSYHLMYFL